MRSGGLLPAPDGWTEMSAEEYRAYRADERTPTRGLTVRTLAEVRGS
jgi:hypothetical protein